MMIIVFVIWLLFIVINRLLINGLLLWSKFNAFGCCSVIFLSWKKQTDLETLVFEIRETGHYGPD